MSGEWAGACVDVCGMGWHESHHSSSSPRFPPFFFFAMAALGVSEGVRRGEEWVERNENVVMRGCPTSLTFTHTRANVSLLHSCDIVWVWPRTDDQSSLLTLQMQESVTVGKRSSATGGTHTRTSAHLQSTRVLWRCTSSKLVGRTTDCI